ncbi:tripartite tricarboxylate transporter TctB family protein [Planococcus lenghuensis]|uniref:Tripartite tricarboxylate transporter TctB family protein n=1 Tax=Planococcus lenghuensis TaxID=2213202 RepID=A0A1Q2KVP7_9BACL|nr:tripartite tricarboxylate transporter TctB family protein [Planococcus lenghuensis]AQQ52213.1 tripartite tricarboxylate transporter TctB family protein [Planococcus lenghuensis]
MKLIKLGMPVFLVLLSIVFLVGTYNLPKAKLGNPDAPLYFPMGVSVLLLVFSIIYLVQELRRANETNEQIAEMLSGRTPLLIGATIALGIGYALIFELLGFLFSTLLFLGALLFVVNGRKKWVANIIVTVVFSFASWYAFSELLGVSLP